MSGRRVGMVTWQMSWPRSWSTCVKTWNELNSEAGYCFGPACLCVRVCVQAITEENYWAEVDVIRALVKIQCQRRWHCTNSYWPLPVVYGPVLFRWSLRFAWILALFVTLILYAMHSLTIMQKEHTHTISRYQQSIAPHIIAKTAMSYMTMPDCVVHRMCVPVRKCFLGSRDAFGHIAGHRNCVPPYFFRIKRLVTLLIYSLRYINNFIYLSIYLL